MHPRFSSLTPNFRFAPLSFIFSVAWVVLIAAASWAGDTGGAGGDAVDGADTGRSSSQELTLQRSVDLALAQNPDILKAKQDVARAYGSFVELRSLILPRVSLGASYDQVDPGTIEIQRGNFTRDKAWAGQAQFDQTLYSGGGIRAGIRAAQLGRENSIYQLREVVDQVVANTRTQFYTVLLNRELIRVQEESVKLLADQLDDQKKRFDAGTVTRLNVLRAEVELANATPFLIRANNNYRLAMLRLARLIGVDINPSDPHETRLSVVGELTVTKQDYDLPLVRAYARQHRSLLQQRRQEILQRGEEVKVAASNARPRVNAVAGWEAFNSQLNDDLGDVIDGWFIGVRGSWNIFDGFETKGRVLQAKAVLEQAMVEYADTERRIDVEVMDAFSRWVEAIDIIAATGKNIEQAREALDIATTRLDQGAGTQLEVFDARVALTQAAVTESQARFDYLVAIIELQRSSGMLSDYRVVFDDPLLQAPWSRKLTESIKAQSAEGVVSDGKP